MAPNTTRLSATEKTAPTNPLNTAHLTKGPDVEAGVPEPAPPPAPKAAPKPNSPWVMHWGAAATGSFLGLGGLFVIENWLRTVHALPDPMLAVGSFAAVATLMYAAPAAPLGKPWPMFYGHFLSILISIAVYYMGEAVGWSSDLTIALSPSLAIGLMVQQGVPHPPAAACSFIFASSLRAHAQPLGGAMYILVPGVIGCAYMLLVQYSLHTGLNLAYEYNQKRRKAMEKDVAMH